MSYFFQTDMLFATKF